MKSYRIDVLLVIDILGSGGAQRQLCELAALLSEGGLSVHVLTYHPDDFYIEFLSTRNIGFTTGKRRLGRARRLAMVWSAIRNMRPRVVCAFLTGPSMIVELARLCRIAKCRVVVSERHVDSSFSLGASARLLMHSLADHVVVNSEAQERFITTQAPWLGNKITCIRNCVDVSRFVPSEGRIECDRFRIVVIGSYIQRKNSLGMLRGFRLFLDAFGDNAASLEWYGNKANLPSVYQATETLRQELRLSNQVRLNDQVEQIEKIYQSADALCLPAFSEATPNVVCEGMAVGLPIIASRVGDVPDIVIEGENGFLFDPLQPGSIAQALARLHSLSQQQRFEMGTRNREQALQLFGKERFINTWLRVLATERSQAA